MTRTRNEPCRKHGISGHLQKDGSIGLCTKCKPDTTAHTPTPWRVERTPETGSIYILDAKNNPVCCMSISGDRGQQWAEEMCRAVNAHAGLVAVMKAASAYVHGDDVDFGRLGDAVAAAEANAD